VKRRKKRASPCFYQPLVSEAIVLKDLRTYQSSLEDIFSRSGLKAGGKNK